MKDQWLIDFSAFTLTNPIGGVSRPHWAPDLSTLEFLDWINEEVKRYYDQFPP